MGVPKHIKEHKQLNVVADPVGFVTNSDIVTSGLSIKTFCIGAKPPFNGTAETLGDGGSMIPHFYPFVFPKPMYFDLVNIGLASNAANNADRLKIGIWSPEGELLFERNLDFIAGTNNAYVSLPHDSINTDVPVAERNPLMPRCVLLSVFPELQSDDTAAATVSIACAPASSKSGTILSHEGFAAAAEDPTTQAFTGPAGFLLNGASITRPCSFHNLGTDWPSVAGSGIDVLTWGASSGFPNAAGNYPAIRLGGDWAA